MFSNATLAFDIFTWSTSISLVWQILKTFANKCLFIILYSFTIITLIMLCLESSFQLFKNSTRMLWWIVFHSTSNKPTKLVLFARVLSSSPKLVKSKIFFRLLLQFYFIGVKMYLTSSPCWVWTFFLRRLPTIACWVLLLMCFLFGI
jgi:hypothetical protein